MKTNHCMKCPKYEANCFKIEDCKITTAEMNRIENGRKKNKIKLVYEHEMTKNQRIGYKNAVDGAFDGD